MLKIQEPEVLLPLVQNPPRTLPSIKTLADSIGVSNKTMSKLMKKGLPGKFRVCLNYPLLRVFTVIVYCTSKRPVQEEEIMQLPFIEELYVTDSFKNEYFLKMKIPKYGMILSAVKQLRNAFEWKYTVPSIAYEYVYDNLMAQDSEYFHVKKTVLTGKDWLLLSALNENPLKTLLEISEETGIPLQTVSYRIKKLAAQKVILGYPFMPDVSEMEKTGFKTYAYVARRWDDLEFSPNVLNVSMFKTHSSYSFKGIAMTTNLSIIRRGLQGSEKAKWFRIKSVTLGNWMRGVVNERLE